MSKTKLEYYMDNPIPSNRSIMGIPRSELACNICGEDVTRFAVIGRERHYNSNKATRKVVKMTVGFFCDECAGDVDELAIAGEPMREVEDD